MNSMITWEQLLISVAAFLIAYYVLVGLIFYRTDLSFLLQQKRITADPLAANRVTRQPSSPATPTKDAALYNAVHELMGELNQVFKAAVSEPLEKQQILEALHYRIHQYPLLKGTAFQVAVSNHIEQQLENECSLLLTPAELGQLWE